MAISMGFRTAAAVFISAALLAGGPAPGPDGRQRPAARPSLTPLLWTQGQSPETIRRVIREVADGGNTGFVWESRPHPDYLGPGWWRDLGVAVEEAERLGLDVWIFDEWMYPSGVAGGKVIEANPDFSHHVLIERSLTAEGPLSEKVWEIPGGLDESMKIVSISAFPEPSGPGRPVMDLSASAAGAGRASVRWAVPPGVWKICWCVDRRDLPEAGWRMDTMIDVLNPEAVATFIRLTHEATYQRFQAHFGKTIKGFFSDETGFRNITSYKSLPGSPGMPMPWSPAFLDYFRKLKGYDPSPLLASLWYDLGSRGRTARFDLMDAFAHALADVFFKPQQEWCRAHGVKLIGHLVEDNGADMQLGYGPGHWFRSMEYLDIPGIDVVGYQVTPGMDGGVNSWIPGSEPLWDQEFFQFGLPAMARGAALIKNSVEIFSEAFGANGWSEGLRMVKWIGDWHIVNGLNFLSPHACTMKYNDPDCPPHFNRTSGNPQWRHYPAWSQYFKRLAALTLASSPVYDAAVLYTAESVWAGGAQTPAPVVRALESRQVQTAVLPYEVFAKEGVIREGRWEYHGQAFPAVVLPYVRFVPADVITKLAEFAEAGGRVIAVDRWPEASVDGRGDETVVEATARLKAAEGACLAAFPGIGGALSSIRRIEVTPESPSLVISRRKAEDGGGEWILIHNRSLDAGMKARMTRLNGLGCCSRYDAEKGVWAAVPQRITGRGMEIDIDIPPYGLWCLEISTAARAVEEQPAFPVREAFPPEWRIIQLDDEGEEIRSLGKMTRLDDWRRIKGLEEFAGTLRYRAALDLPAALKGERLAIDAGEAADIAELRVNGRSAGVRLCPPYVWDITGFLDAGANVIDIDVTNTAQARWNDPMSHGDAVSGLLGPVTVMRRPKR
ncbi:MAG: hypothetical protein PHX45_05830 [Acidobacteriota bacterium]|nr:hypothetical protein [Acidobacteriota bacterium]